MEREQRAKGWKEGDGDEDGGREGRVNENTAREGAYWVVGSQGPATD